MKAAAEWVVAAEANGVKMSEFGVWVSKRAADNCSIAMMRKYPDDMMRLLCSGDRVLVATVRAGTEVERIDPNDCGTMATIRILSGKASGKIGCIYARALSKKKP